MSTSCSHPTAGYLSRSEGEFDYNDYDYDGNDNDEGFAKRLKEKRSSVLSGSGFRAANDASRVTREGNSRSEVRVGKRVFCGDSLGGIDLEGMSEAASARARFARALGFEHGAPPSTDTASSKRVFPAPTPCLSEPAVRRK